MEFIDNQRLFDYRPISGVPFSVYKKWGPIYSQPELREAWAAAPNLVGTPLRRVAAVLVLQGLKAAVFTRT